MKNFHSLQLTLALIGLFLGLTASASLPELTNGSSADAFPITVSGSNSQGHIDVDNNGSVDFVVYYSGSGSYSSCYIADYNYDSPAAVGLTVVSSGNNRILTEYELYPDPSIAPQNGVQPLTEDNGGEYFTTMLPYGASINGGLSNWRRFGYVFYPMYGPRSPLNSSSNDGLNSGYLGVYYTGNTGYYYGWLNVTINSSGTSVTINSAGSASAANDPVPAGLNDPFAVPFPLIASIFGFALVGGGVWLKRKRKK